jgi:hypothetical protein
LDALELLGRQALAARYELADATSKLTPEEAHWPPPGHTNPIAAVWLHLLGLEDWVVQRTVQGRQMLWDASGWGVRLHAPHPGRLTLEGARATHVDLRDVETYELEVHKATDDLLAMLAGSEDLARAVHGHWGPAPLGALLSSALITHKLPHVGEIRATRGLQGTRAPACTCGHGAR